MMACPVARDVSSQLEAVNWDFAGYNPSAGPSSDLLSLHWYPAPFPAALAATLIDILGTGSGNFLDPFSGTGTAAFEAWARGYRATGIDINGFAVRLATAKTRLICDGHDILGRDLAADYLRFRGSLIEAWSGRDAEDVCSAMGADKDAARWFTAHSLSELAIAKRWMMDAVEQTWRLPLVVLLSSILHKPASIVRRYHYTYIVDRSRVKTEAHEDVDVAGIFAEKIRASFLEGQLVRETLQKVGLEITQETAPLFIHGAAEDLPSLAAGVVDLVVTSPPYFGMNDYVRSQYLSWLIFQWDGFGEDVRRECGSRRQRWSSQALDRYHTALRAAFGGLLEQLTPGGYLAMVVGHSSGRLASSLNVFSSLGDFMREQGAREVWRGERTVRFRKITMTSRCRELIWVWRR